MRSYSSGFFDCRRLATDLCHTTNSPRRRLYDALMLVLTLAVIVLEAAHEITGISALNLCAELLDGLYSAMDKRFSP